MRRQHGFTLVEMMVAVLLSAGTVLLASKVAEIVASQTIRGAAATEGHDRGALIVQQVRVDLQVAGYGSTGLIIIDPTVFPGMVPIASEGNYNSIAAVSGANNVNGVNIGGNQVQSNSDVLQLVVPDTSSMVRIEDTASEGVNILTVNPALNCLNGFIYIVDHSRFNGAGRTQIAPAAGAGGLTPSISGALAFNV